MVRGLPMRDVFLDEIQSANKALSRWSQLTRHHMNMWTRTAPIRMLIAAHLSMLCPTGPIPSVRSLILWRAGSSLRQCRRPVRTGIDCVRATTITR